ncbi:anhydro-N-acetylmuramic acid kinase [Sphingomonas sp. 3-13AW]|jgi:anhydro-N-acetylmuramic acid kinase|uniref:anhydro-N-acetylmuramic acid kinase n=1 Tax=Sphingomonas sp. 3-13AW TaxID=3050450 RepID=UPI003BB5C21E
MRVLGYMSGTSLDGVDAAILETDGERIAGFGPALMLPFNAEERRVLEQATADAVASDGRGPRPASFAEAERVIHDVHVRAARELLAQPDAGTIELVGFHGQTVLHRPERKLSIQLGDPDALAVALGVPVVADLRQADLAAGGQGAPLAPIYHAALADWAGCARPVAFLNIGGVANVTVIGRDGSLAAFDVGPGNGLIDQLVQARGLGRYDEGGRVAAAGTVDRAVVDRLMESPYFTRTGAKSLDRYDFPLDAVAALSDADAAATLTAFTVAAVVASRAQLDEPPAQWIVCGGGRHNPVMMAMLADALGRADSSDTLGMRGDFIEAEAFAYLAARSVRGLPISFPGTTGAPEPMTGGVLYRG